MKKISQNIFGILILVYLLFLFVYPTLNDEDSEGRAVSYVEAFNEVSKSTAKMLYIDQNSLLPGDEDLLSSTTIIDTVFVGYTNDKRHIKTITKFPDGLTMCAISKIPEAYFFEKLKPHDRILLKMNVDEVLKSKVEEEYCWDEVWKTDRVILLKGKCIDIIKYS